ncbi:MAG: ABC transporter permease subunit, partial [Hyphomicrobiaceae bacterium]
MPVVSRSLGLHLGVIALLFVFHFILPQYHHGILARVMVLAVFAMGYNIAFGYTGLLSLGHAVFFAAGMYGTGLSAIHLGFSPLPAIAVGAVGALVVSTVIGALALRTAGVALMIVTLMFAQAGWYLILYLGEWTRGDEG